MWWWGRGLASHTKNHYKVDVLYIVALGIFTTGDLGLRQRKTNRKKWASSPGLRKDMTHPRTHPQGYVWKESYRSNKKKHGLDRSWKIAEEMCFKRWSSLANNLRVGFRHLGEGISELFLKSHINVPVTVIWLLFFTSRKSVLFPNRDIHPVFLHIPQIKLYICTL